MLVTFTEWLKKMREMAGVTTIVTKKDCHNPDYNVWGAVCGSPKSTPAVPKKQKKD